MFFFFFPCFVLSLVMFLKREKRRQKKFRPIFLRVPRRFESRHFMLNFTHCLLLSFFLSFFFNGCQRPAKEWKRRRRHFRETFKSGFTPPLHLLALVHFMYFGRGQNFGLCRYNMKSGGQKRVSEWVFLLSLCCLLSAIHHFEKNFFCISSPTSTPPSSSLCSVFLHSSSSSPRRRGLVSQRSASIK